MDMLRKLSHIVLIVALVLSPVVSAVSATLMSGDYGTLNSSSLNSFSTTVSHHIHSESVISDSSMTAQIVNKTQTSSSQSCCLDCDDECTQACMLCITQASTLSLSHSLNASISFFEFPYSFISITSPDRPPRVI